MNIGDKNLDKLKMLLKDIGVEPDTSYEIEEEPQKPLYEFENLEPVEMKKAYDNSWNYIKDQSFVNPYNFVSIDKDVKREPSMDFEKTSNKTLTGWIECNLEPKTELFIPKIKEDERETLSMLTDQDGDPFIPGSSLRGVIRSAYEAVTNSCLSTAGSWSNLYKRTPVPKKNYLILKKEKGIWKAYDAKKCMIKYRFCKTDSFDEKKLARDKYGEGEKVFVSTSTITYKTSKGHDTGIHMIKDIKRDSADGYEKGYAHITPDFTKKHHQSVFIPIRKANLSDDIIEKIRINFEDTIKHSMELHKKDGGAAKEYKIYSDINNAYKRGIALVYYCQLDEFIYASPSCISVEVFNTKILEILKGQHKHEPCSHRSNLCQTCRLFGMTGETDKSSIASRVRFTDAKISCETKKKGKENYLMELLDGEYITFELGSPKVSSTEFYLKNPEVPGALMWNYDYAIMDYPSGKSEKFQFIEDYRAKIKGRKFYWHFKPKLNKGKITNTNTAIKSYVKKSDNKSILFNFRIYFNNITKDELNKLLWVITIGESEKHGHKIGCGKPYGLGSIKIEVAEVKNRQIDLENKDDIYSINDYDYSKELRNNVFINEDEIYIKEFLAMTRLDNGFENVCYPIGETKVENKESRPMDNTPAQWFMGNKSSRNGRENFKPTIVNVLPTPIETVDGKRLYKYYKYKRSGSGKKSFY
ncbi:UNVERIFIED_CONTAM: CRISPR-associated protein (TIGR03986 family) [Acetivibrio alkalicellulosi]